MLSYGGMDICGGLAKKREEGVFKGGVDTPTQTMS